MIKPGIPDNETERLAALLEYQLNGEFEEAEYKDIVIAASDVCNVPTAFISIIEENKQRIIASTGLNINETTRDVSFCGHTINKPAELTIISDARKDPRFSDNPLVTGEPKVVFYAGVPLVDDNGFALGTLCIMDNSPRTLTDGQLKILKILSRKILAILSLKRTNRILFQERKNFFELLNNTTPFFLLINTEGKILESGKNYKKAVPELENGTTFDLFFNWEGNLTFREIVSSGHSKLYFFSCKNQKQRYKCSIRHYNQNAYLLYAIAVVNADLSIGNYKINLNDFPKQDYIAEFLFLQQGANRGLKESERLNNSLRTRNNELELAKNALVNANAVLEQRIEERTKQIKNLALFPEQNPNPVLEIDISQEKINYMNPAAKKQIFRNGDLDYEQLYNYLKLESRQKTDYESGKLEISNHDKIYERSLFYTNTDTIRIYLHDITLIRNNERKERLRQEKSLLTQKTLLNLRNINREIALAEKFKIILRETSGIMGCSRCSVWLYNSEQGSIASEFIYSAENDSFIAGLTLFKKDFPAYFKALASKTVIDAEDAEMHPATCEFKDVYLRPLNIVSMLYVPLIKSNELIGVLCCEYTGTRREFSEEDINFSRSVSDVIILAIESDQLMISNSRLTELNANLKDAYDQLVALQSDVIKQEKLATLGTLIAGIAHEINTPLGAIKASNDNLNDSFLNLFSEQVTKLGFEDMHAGVRLFLLSNKKSFPKTTREERNSIRKLEAELIERKIRIENSNFFAQKIVQLNHDSLSVELIDFIKHPNAIEIFSFASNLSKVVKSIHTIGLAADKATRVVRAMNNFSHGNIDGEITLFNLKESIDNVIIVLWNRIKQGVSINLDLQDDFLVKGNQEELSQVWTNIINNAIQASNAKCTINIKHVSTDRIDTLIFANDGPMIPEDVLPKIFDPFFSTKKRGEGTGLGLNIVKKIIEKHKGEIFCESNALETRFIINLPK